MDFRAQIRTSLANQHLQKALDLNAERRVTRRVNALATLPGRPRSLIVGLRGGTLLLTEDAGESWRRLEVELDDVIDLVAVPG